MNKFEVKAYECEILNALYQNIENRKDWDAIKWNPETDEQEPDPEKIAILDGMIAKLEKLL